MASFYVDLQGSLCSYLAGLGSLCSYLAGLGSPCSCFAGLLLAHTSCFAGFLLVHTLQVFYFTHSLQVYDHLLLSCLESVGSIVRFTSSLGGNNPTVCLVAAVTERGNTKITPITGINKNSIKTIPFPMACPLF